MHKKDKPTLNPKFTFEEFVIGPSNSFAHAAAVRNNTLRRILDNPEAMAAVERIEG